MTCTCLEASQCAVQRSHEQFSGRQSHASFEDYIRICLSQQQQTHTGKKIQWTTYKTDTEISPCMLLISSSAMTSSCQHYLASFCPHVTTLWHTETSYRKKIWIFFVEMRDTHLHSTQLFHFCIFILHFTV